MKISEKIYNYLFAADSEEKPLVKEINIKPFPKKQESVIYAAQGAPVFFRAGALENIPQDTAGIFKDMEGLNVAEREYYTSFAK